MNPPTGENLAEAILRFWFGDPPTTKAEIDARMRRWFGGGADQDAVIAARFGTAMAAAGRGDLDEWAASARGRLALILLLDQLPRNVHRGTRSAFEFDAKALDLTLSGIDRRLDQTLGPLERMFFYMPMQHAESLEIQERAVAEFSRLANGAAEPPLRHALAGAADYARQHRDIIARFGRFPHRNKVLGRKDTPVESSYLAKDAPKFGQ